MSIKEHINDENVDICLFILFAPKAQEKSPGKNRYEAYVENFTYRQLEIDMKHMLRI